MAKVMLREIAHGRAGDKGDTSNISVIPYEERYYELIKEQVTAERVEQYFAGICFGGVTRYEAPGIKGLNFVLKNALDGGLTRSTRFDGLGKSLSQYMLSMTVEI